jgi:hypothetical protein
MAIRDFAVGIGPDRTTEKRGVPGSSPGLTIQVATRRWAVHRNPSGSCIASDK